VASSLIEPRRATLASRAYGVTIAPLIELRGYRNLFRMFLRRDISARYKGSILGVVWSLLNPLVMMLIYTVVFTQLLKIRNAPDYPAFFIVGFLPWFFFSTSLTMGAITLLSHQSLLQKVYFPREVLPLSSVAANLVNMVIAFVIFLPYAFIVRGFHPVAFLTLIPVTLFFFIFTAGLVVLLSAVTVYFRDIEFLLGLVLSAWFYVVPIIYSLDNIPNHMLRRWLERDPIVPFINAFRDTLYYGKAVTLPGLLFLAALALCVWIPTYAVFNNIKGRIAEEL
jgi:lipopolysaccharide transport system permease protein